MSGYRGWGKRFFDVALSGVGLGLFALPMLGITVWIRCDYGSPVFFPQERIGRDGRRFTILKFRTMREDKQVASGFAQKLRDTAMDELPQLINILRGEMSFVGPRPLIPEELDQLASVPDGPDRLKAVPGLTGLAQLNDAKVPSLYKRTRWDLTYIKRYSFRMDLWIIIQSVLITCQGTWEQKGPNVSRRA